MWETNVCNSWKSGEIAFSLEKQGKWKEMDIILEKVSEIFQELKKQATRSSHEHLEIKDTTGWFVKFKKRTGIKHLVIPGECVSADKETDNFFIVFLKIRWNRII